MKPHDMGVLFDECAEHRVHTQVHLDRPFDIDTGARTHYTLPQLATLVREAAGWLTAAGAGPGDRVAIVKDNHWDYDLLACAAVRVGAVPAQLSAHLSGEVLGTLLARLGPALLVTTAQVLERGRREGTDLAAAARATLVLDAAVPGTLGIDDVRGHTAPGPHRRHDDEPLVVHHTSGTTGVPKLVVHSTRTIVRKLARFESVRLPRIGLRRGDTLVNASAFAHGRTFCWTASALCMGPAAISIITTQDPNLADPVLRAHPPTVLEALPASFVRFQPLTEGLDNPFRRLRLVISTYDAMHPPTVRAYLRASRHRSPLWVEGWGQTETGPLTFRFHTRNSVHRASEGSGTRNLGRPVPGKTRLRVVDPDTLRPLPRGQAGLVLARTAACALGYVGEEDRWSAKRHGSWWNTGDIGARNRDGSIDLLDREVDRTPQLSCLRTEDLLETRLPQALECVVLAEPGRDPLPVVVTADGAMDRARWKEAVRDLPPLREPVALTWDQVPRTGTGKVRRRELLHRLTGRSDTYGSGRWT
ncbi:AMP-binding protein [Streptomyces lomondensis]|uniref:Fatty-acid-CoA ligase FadD n=2 Tax=Streptomyces lomondensis TaxID=68229 RepID=A0ABQ2X635_9ACTN|nr:AMP-binding protein [Streptomyces lomondensis]MCF0078211.1 AMP-binding protein [Streptomyces lomondensis]GGX01241.1 putative fatty-acid-CoA ligase FadD [Streptomyces lomondensis]